MGIAPVFWASFSDYYRIRRFFLILSMVIFAFSSLGCALVNNIGGLVVLRCIQSVSSSAAQSVGAGVVADCYPVENEVQRLTNSFWVSLSARLSVSFDLLLLLRLLFTFTNMIYILGPIIGGFLIMSELTWKATFWFCFAFGMAVFLYLFFLYPETYRDNAKFDAADVGDAETIKNVPTTTATHPKINPIEPFSFFDIHLSPLLRLSLVLHLVACLQSKRLSRILWNNITDSMPGKLVSPQKSSYFLHVYKDSFCHRSQLSRCRCWQYARNNFERFYFGSTFATIKTGSRRKTQGRRSTCTQLVAGWTHLYTFRTLTLWMGHHLQS